MWMLWAVLTTAGIVLALRFLWYAVAFTVYWRVSDDRLGFEKAARRRKQKAELAELWPGRTPVGHVLCITARFAFLPRTLR